MEQSSANENVISENNETIEICLNGVVLEGGFEENPTIQTETNRILENDSEEIMKENLKKLHAQRKIWKPHGRTSLCWIFFHVNNNVEVDSVNTQIMHCILCYQNSAIGINLGTQVRKTLIFYYKTNGITSFKKHVDANHSFITQMFEEVNILLKSTEEKQALKKRTNPFGGSIFKFFLSKIPSKRRMCHIKNF